jgi:AraC family transcriptional regulator
LHVNFDTLPFTEIPPIDSVPQTRNYWSNDVPWRIAHPYGLLLYCPASFDQVHVRLNHHLIGIELNPGIVSLRIDHGLEVTSVQKCRTFYFAPAGSVIEAQKETPIEYILLTFDPRSFKRLPAFPVNAIDNMMDPLVTAKALAFRQQFLKDGQAIQLAFELVHVALRALSRACFSRAYRNALAHLNHRLDPGRVLRALAFIDEHCFTKITVGEVADAVGNISAFHFSHAFEATLGQSPHQYLLEQRVRHAREMMRLGSISIADIAHTVGFSSQSHMTDTFTRRLGITPAQLRKSVVVGSMYREEGDEQSKRSRNIALVSGS